LIQNDHTELKNPSFKMKGFLIFLILGKYGASWVAL